MTTPLSPPSGTAAPRTSLTRERHKASTERAALDTLLDAVHIGHFALVADGGPVVLPTAIARDGDRVLAHGSTGSRWLRALGEGAPAALAVTALDGLVVARSAFESSMLYRSAVLFGCCTRLSGADVLVALDVLTEALIPGRTSEVRRPAPRELDATLVLALPIETWSLKISDGWPDDPPEDVSSDAWAGVVPLSASYAAPRAAPDLRTGVGLPASVRALR